MTESNGCGLRRVLSHGNAAATPIALRSGATGPIMRSAAKLQAVAGWVAARCSGTTAKGAVSDGLTASSSASSWMPFCSNCCASQLASAAALQAFKACVGSGALGSSMSTAPLDAMMRRTGLLATLRLTGGQATRTTAWGGRAAFATAAAASTSGAGASMRNLGNSLLTGSEALTHGLEDRARKQMVWWLGGTAVWVYSMVVLGGVTRLTRSGLSMTDWKFTGERPPITQEEWQAQFDKYRASPEFRKVHSKMTLEEFKFIFWMEYAHRMWGRLLGLAFVVPGAYFLGRGYINAALGKRLGLLLFMGGTQGLVGWWMVRSGLQEPEHEWDTPRVSPYRLAAHLVSAFTIYSILVWTAMDLAYPKAILANANRTVQEAARRARGGLLPFAAVVAITATSGAFVAGKDAGRAYNTYPLMNGKFFPDEYWDSSLKPYIRNTFENTAAIQFHHRMLAGTTALAALLLWPWVRKAPVPASTKQAMDVVAGVTVLQMGLGIATLLNHVPVSLGSAHQANALNLFTSVLLVLHTLRPAYPGPFSHKVARFGTPLAVALVAAIGLAVTTNE